MSDVAMRKLLATLGIGLVLCGLVLLLAFDAVHVAATGVVLIFLGVAVVALGAIFHDDILVRARSFEVSVQKRRRR